MGINLYLASELEYKRGLAHRLVDEQIVDFCLVNCLPWTEMPQHKKIITVDHGPSLFEEYDRVCDLNDLPAVSKQLMEDMLPYESTAIKMGCRRLDAPTSEYEEEKRKYLQHLRYWNYMLDRYRINLIVMNVLPHSQGTFVVYGLAHVKRIPILCWQQQDSFLKRMVWGDSIEGMGLSIKDRYTKLTISGTERFDLDDDILEDYERICGKSQKSDVVTFNRRMNQNTSAFRRKQAKDRKKEYRRQYMRSVVKSIVYSERPSMYERKAVWFRICRRSFAALAYYRRHLTLSICCYDKKYAKEADLTRKYILFLPQVVPESTTLPQAGVFAEQYNSIQLLARVAKKNNMYVYVKEHPHSPSRDKLFYDEIRFIDNVELIKSVEPTYRLMKHSVGVSTQTGTCILEAVFMKKPVFVFSEGYVWKGCPGVYEITDEIQGADIIKKAKDEIIEDEDIRRYLYAIQLETIKEVVPEEMNAYAMHPESEAPYVESDDKVELIKSFIGGHINVE